MIVEIYQVFFFFWPSMPLVILLTRARLIFLVFFLECSLFHFFFFSFFALFDFLDLFLTYLTLRWPCEVWLIFLFNFLLQFSFIYFKSLLPREYHISRSFFFWILALNSAFIVILISFPQTSSFWPFLLSYSSIDGLKPS